MINSSKSEGNEIFLEDLFYIDDSTSDNIFPLKTDNITKMKQTILAIPNMNYILDNVYQEVMSPTDFPSFCLFCDIGISPVSG